MDEGLTPEAFLEQLATPLFPMSPNLFGVLEEDGTVTALDIRSEEDLVFWAQRAEFGRQIAYEQLAEIYEVSTVFLPVNQAMNLDKPGVWFETAIIRKGGFEIYGRAIDKEMALRMHERAVTEVRARILIGESDEE